MRDVLALALGVVAAIAVVLFTTPEAGRNLRFHLGLFDRQAISAEVESTVMEFDSMYARFFTSGGDLTGLGEFPAENLVKRRIVQDINSWSMRDQILSHDRFKFRILNIELLNPSMAAVETEEAWAFIVRDRKTGQRLIGREGGQQNNNIKARYYLRRGARGWRVAEFEVYAPGDNIPPVPRRWRG